MAQGAINNISNFLGIKKFGQGLATTGRVLTGATGKDIARQNENTANVNKILYAAKQETDPEKRRRLLMLAQNFGAGTSAAEIDPGLNLSNKEILGSAANIGLNIATPGAFKGGKAAIIGKNAALGSAFGAASGLEQDRDLSGVLGSATGGAIVGAGIGALGVGAKALKNFATATTPKWLMDKAIKPTLDEARKSVKYGQKTLGEELLKEGVKGNPQKLLEIADNKLTSLENELQSVINNPNLAEARIKKTQLEPYLKDLMETKAGIPGLQGDVQRVKNVFDSIPEELTLQEANQMKRRIYNELRDVSYKLDAKLGTKAKALKMIASGLKQEIEDTVGGTIVKDINQKLSIYGRLENRITDQLARSMRSNAFGLSDVILTSGGIATMNPLGVLSALGAVGAKNVVGSTGFKTGLAQRLSGMQSMGTGRAGQIVKGTAQRAGFNIP